MSFLCPPARPPASGTRRLKFTWVARAPADRGVLRTRSGASGSSSIWHLERPAPELALSIANYRRSEGAKGPAQALDLSPPQDVDDLIHLKGGLVAASSPPLMIATATMLAEGYNVALVNVLASRAPGEQG
ncbi:hypothetical protein K523DRAFT_357609 [Schizophyllum commune Tattone D]|nr:hypothetical protein K523DRAFT_357609 [Schizophyllum commune Tattone D]